MVQILCSLAVLAAAVSAELLPSVLTNDIVRPYYDEHEKFKPLTDAQLKAVQDDADVNRECHRANGGYLELLMPGSYQASKFHKCFRTGEQIDEIWDVFVKQNPTVLTKFEISKSVQNKTIYGYKFSTRRGLQSIYFETLIHAREWVTGSSITYALSRWLDDLVTGVKEATKYHDFVIVPLVNPDGYNITWNGNRLQRKNKNEVDLNRNFVSKYVNPNPPGPKDQTYPGPYPFSEPETAGINEWGLKNHDNVIGWVDIHSNAASVMYPYGDTLEPIGGGEDEKFIRLGTAVRDAINKVNGKNDYNTQTSAGLYPAYGCFDDYHYRKYGKPTLTLEMSGDNFVIPNTDIPLHGDELYYGLTEFSYQVTVFNASNSTKPSC
ncbi:hypothetical protein AeMF1_006119 [Aphanomyces euteiches]|nr:hypothetical protein AeMF1_006119 [Aphanomyces euteiches]KAH9183144.1 hypothetical protein AeNC1_014881 [Aphanomyces euteiches]